MNLSLENALIISKKVSTSQSAVEFRRILQKYCEEPKPMKGVLIEYLNERGQEDRLIEFAEQHFILNDVYVGGGVELFGEFGLVASLQDEEQGGLLFGLGYLEVGHCPNGDYVIADVGSEFGVVRYICHEECAADNDFEGFSEYSKVVATSLGEFVFGLDQGAIGSDYFDEPSLKPW